MKLLNPKELWIYFLIKKTNKLFSYKILSKIIRVNYYRFYNVKKEIKIGWRRKSRRGTWDRDWWNRILG